MIYKTQNLQADSACGLNENSYGYEDKNDFDAFVN